MVPCAALLHGTFTIIYYVKSFIYLLTLTLSTYLVIKFMYIGSF